MSKIVLNSKDLDGKNKLQFMIQKYGDNIIWYDGKFTFHIKDEDNEFGRRFKVDVLSEEEEKVRKYASHLYHKGSLWKVISEWRKNLIDEVREKKKKINIWDPIVDGNFSEYSDKYNWNSEPQLYFIATKHEEFDSFPFLEGSTIIDPWRYISSKKNIKLIRVGDSKK